MGTHQELEMFGNQPAYPEKLLHKKESLQNQLINIRVELSQATTVGNWEQALCTPSPRSRRTPPSPCQISEVTPGQNHPSRAASFCFRLSSAGQEHSALAKKGQKQKALLLSCG